MRAMARSLIPYVETVEDSRVRGIHPVTGKRAAVETTEDRKNVRIYCISCHHPGAFISADMAPAVDGGLVIWLCEFSSPCGCDCAGTKGELPLPRLAL